MLGSFSVVSLRGLFRTSAAEGLKRRFCSCFKSLMILKRFILGARGDKHRPNPELLVAVAAYRPWLYPLQCGERIAMKWQGFVRHSGDIFFRSSLWWDFCLWSLSCRKDKRWQELLSLSGGSALSGQCSKLTGQCSGLAGARGAKLRPFTVSAYLFSEEGFRHSARDFSAPRSLLLDF